MALCLTDKDFQKILKTNDLPSLEFPTQGSTTFVESLCFVCINESAMDCVLAAYGLLVHESVHVWQHACTVIGERKAGEEIEAYSIQSIAQTLIDDYNKQMKIKIIKPRQKAK
jgi:hypothetical protein